MSPVLQSCVAGTDPCNDVHMGPSGLEWLEWIGVLPVVVLIVLIAWFVVRRVRRR